MYIWGYDIIAGHEQTKTSPEKIRVLCKKRGPLVNKEKFPKMLGEVKCT